MEQKDGGRRFTRRALSALVVAVAIPAAAATVDARRQGFYTLRPEYSMAQTHIQQ